MNIVLSNWQALLIVFIIAACQFFSTTWIKAEIESSVQAKYNFELKARERAEKVAEYMAIVGDIKKSSPEEDYHRANRLAWELGMWLPADVYRALGQAIVKPDSKVNPASVVISVRKVLLEENAGSLTQDDIIFHAPGIGKKSMAEELSESNRGQ